MPDLLEGILVKNNRDDYNEDDEDDMAELERRKARDRIIRRCAGLFIEKFKKDNRAARNFMLNHMQDRHKEKLDLRAFRVRFNCSELLKKEMRLGYDPGDVKNWETLTILIEIYIHQTQTRSKYNYSYSKEEMSEVSESLLKNYNFYYPSDKSNGRYYSRWKNFWLFRITEHLAESYESGFETAVDADLSKYNYNQDFIQALKDFPENYGSRLNGSASIGRHTKTFVHEYLHFVYDELDIARENDRYSQTVNEAFSWFISYLIAKEEGFRLGSPSDSYKEPEKIEHLAKLLLEKYGEGSDTPAVSWVMDLQEEVYGSEKSQLEALLYHLIPERLETRMEDYTQAVKNVRKINEEFSSISHSYESFYREARKSESVERDLLEDYKEALQEFEEDLSHSVPDESVDAVIDRMGQSIVEGDKEWDDAASIFHMMAEQEYRDFRSVYHDFSALERDLREMGGISRDVVREKVNRAEEQGKEMVEINKASDLVVNLVLLQKRVEKVLEELDTVSH